VILAIHPQLAERAVFEAVRADATVACLFHRQFANCYTHRDPLARDEAFEALHQRWFDELGLRDRVAGLVAEFAHIRDHVARFMLAPASAPRRQTIELFGSPSHYTLVGEISPTLLLDPPAFAYWSRHELLHIDDMLDPAFAFDGVAVPGGANAAAKSLAHDRFAVLWAISVDARLSARAQATDDVREKRLIEFTRLSSSRDSAESEAKFAAIWARFLDQPPTHAALLDLARAGVFENDAETPAQADMPGAACPLCQFPTFDWASRDDLRGIGEAVRADFQHWREADGACRRCLEVYRVHAGLPTKTVDLVAERV